MKATAPFSTWKMTIILLSHTWASSEKVKDEQLSKEWSIKCWTDPNGHLLPDFGIDETRSKSWKTLLLAPAAFIATVYNPDSPDTEDPTASCKE
mgnify:CR=1 FL=1